MVESGTRYHHGDLPAALLAATALAIEETGVAGLSLRDVARRAEVSHAAPAHHFANRQGLLTAFAAQGFERFAAALAAVPEEDPTERLRAQARAYVGFALDHRAHFEVMWRPELCDTDDEGLVGPRLDAYLQLWGSVEAMLRARGTPDPGAEQVQDAVLACWSAVHGLAWLILQGALPPDQSSRSAGELTDAVTATMLAGADPR